MWRFLLLVIAVFLIGCAGGMDKPTFESREGVDPEPATLPTSAPTHSVTSQADTEVEVMPALPNLGSAPELTNEVWLNSDRPLRLTDLRGQVVLIDMWTFG